MRNIYSMNMSIKYSKYLPMSYLENCYSFFIMYLCTSTCPMWQLIHHVLTYPIAVKNMVSLSLEVSYVLVIL